MNRKMINHKYIYILLAFLVSSIFLFTATEVHANHSGTASVGGNTVNILHGYHNNTQHSSPGDGLYAAGNSCNDLYVRNDTIAPGSTRVCRSTDGSDYTKNDIGMPVNDVNQFINYIDDKLNATGSDASVVQDRVSSAFIVNSMMGVSRGSSTFTTATGGVTHARSIFDDWETRVQNFDNAAIINWNATRNFGDPSLNTLWSIGMSTTASNRDVAVYNSSGTANAVWTIEFTDTNGNLVYAIKKNCGNPMGVIGELPDYDPFETHRVYGDRIGVGDVPDSLITGTQVRVRNPADGSNFDESDTDGMSFNFTNLQRESGPIRITATNPDTSMFEIRVNTRLCSSSNTNCTSWSNGSWTTNTTASREWGSSLQENGTIRVQVEYRFRYIDVVGTRIPTGGLSDTDVSDERVRARSPFTSPWSTDLSDTSGTTFNMRVNNLNNGRVRVVAESSDAGQQIRMRSCPYAYGSTCDNDDWSGFTDWNNSSVSQNRGSSLSRGGTFQVEVEYRPVPITISDIDATCQTFSYTVDVDTGFNHDAQLEFRNTPTGSWQTPSSSTFRRSNQTNDSYSFDIGSFRDFGTREFRVVITQNGTTNTRNSTEAGNDSPCANIECGNLTTNPGLIEAGQPFEVRFNFTVALTRDDGAVDTALGTNARSFTFSANVSGDSLTGIDAGQMSTPPPDGTSTSGTISSSQNTAGASLYRGGIIAPNAGTYQLQVAINSLNPDPLNCPDSGAYEVDVSDLPYVSAFGADVLASSGFRGTTCSSGPPTGIINTLVSDDSGRGSGAQFAAIAMTQINQFTSATMRTSAPTIAKGLTFANVGIGAGGTLYGGGYQVQNCSTDYFGSIDFASLDERNSNQGSFVTNNDGEYRLSNQTMQSLSIADGKNFALYRDADTRINGNIEYQNESWGSSAEMPSFYLIVKGDLYIAPGVTRLDGTYIVQPRDDGTRGYIYTCATGMSAVPLAELYDDKCPNQLQVNGSLIAQRTIFNRYANSSAGNATVTEFPYATVDNTCVDSVARPVCAAEVINYSPEIFLSNPALPPISSPGQSRYDAITSLPPIL